MSSEATLMRQIQVGLSRIGARLFRNQVGRYELSDGRYINSGLAVGSSDLIGWHTVLVTEDLIGKSVAIFAAVEVKSPKGRLSQEQSNFLAAVQAAGGIAVVARSEAEALQGITQWKI